jgi:hypothetical protein
MRMLSGSPSGHAEKKQWTRQAHAACDARLLSAKSEEVPTCTPFRPNGRPGVAPRVDSPGSSGRRAMVPRCSPLFCRQGVNLGRRAASVRMVCETWWPMRELDVGPSSAIDGRWPMRIVRPHEGRIVQLTDFRGAAIDLVSLRHQTYPFGMAAPVLRVFWTLRTSGSGSRLLRCPFTNHFGHTPKSKERSVIDHHAYGRCYKSSALS